MFIIKNITVKPSAIGDIDTPFTIAISMDLNGYAGASPTFGIFNKEGVAVGGYGVPDGLSEQVRDLKFYPNDFAFPLTVLTEGKYTIACFVDDNSLVTWDGVTPQLDAVIAIEPMVATFEYDAQQFDGIARVNNGAGVLFTPSDPNLFGSAMAKVGDGLLFEDGQDFRYDGYSSENADPYLANGYAPDIYAFMQVPKAYLIAIDEFGTGSLSDYLTVPQCKGLGYEGFVPQFVCRTDGTVWNNLAGKLASVATPPLVSIPPTETTPEYPTTLTSPVVVTIKTSDDGDRTYSRLALPNNATHWKLYVGHTTGDSFGEVHPATQLDAIDSIHTPAGDFIQDITVVACDKDGILASSGTLEDISSADFSENPLLRLSFNPTPEGQVRVHSATKVPKVVVTPIASLLRATEENLTGKDVTETNLHDMNLELDSDKNVEVILYSSIQVPSDYKNRDALPTDNTEGEAQVTLQYINPNVGGGEAQVARFDIPFEALNNAADRVVVLGTLPEGATYTDIQFLKPTEFNGTAYSRLWIGLRT